MVCAIYVRKSKQNDNSQSMETQISMCKDYISSHFPDSTILIFDKDYGITGHSISKRKDFQKMMNEVKSGHIDVVLIQRYDRLSRNMRDFCNTYHELQQHNCALVSVGQDIDTSTPYGRKFMYDLASTAELEWELNSVRRKDINLYSASIGRCNLGYKAIPVGYKIEKINGIRKLVIDEETEPIIRELIEYRRMGGSRTTVSKYLNERFGTHFSQSIWQTFCRSSFYYGEYKGFENYCPAYLSKEEWEKITIYNGERIKQNIGNVFLFTSKIRCPHCNVILAPQSKKGKKANYFYYRCESYYKSGLNRCDFTLCVNEQHIEDFLLNNIDKYLSDLQASVERKEEVRKKKSNIKKYLDELERLNKMFLKGRIEESFYDSEYIRLQSIIQKEKAESEEKNVKKISLNFPSNWQSVYNELTKENKKTFWQQTIEKIIIDDNKNVIDITFK